MATREVRRMNITDDERASIFFFAPFVCPFLRIFSFWLGRRVRFFFFFFLDLFGKFIPFSFLSFWSVLRSSLCSVARWARFSRDRPDEKVGYFVID